MDFVSGKHYENAEQCFPIEKVGGLKAMPRLDVSSFLDLWQSIKKSDKSIKMNNNQYHVVLV